MKAWKVKELGEPEDVLVLEETNGPAPAEDEVIIKVESCALNFFDILLCQGKYQEKPPLPFTFGSEVSGIVISGDHKRFKEGDRVMALPRLPYGGLAEYVSVPAGAVYSIPNSMPWADAAAMSITYRTSHYALSRRAQLQAGEVLLVHAGAGGVGSSAIQLGKAAGATVIATAGGSEKTAICRELGADIVVDYLEDDFVKVVKDATGGKGADVIYDPVGGDVFDRSKKCIAFDGRILVIGFAGGRIPELAINHVLIKNYSLVGVHYGYYARLFPEKVEEEHAELMAMYEQGKIKPLIYKEFSFQDVPQALKLLGSRQTWGKAVVNIST